VASLTFIEPEPQPEAEAEESADEVVDVDLENVSDVEVEQEVITNVGDDEPVLMLDSEQLNLF
jgi:hypothetical protein